jgi:hypothetical protein
MRKTAAAKGRPLLVGGAVFVLEVNPHRCTASVKGDSSTHAVTFDGDRWSCAAPRSVAAVTPWPWLGWSPCTPSASTRW